MYLMQSTLEHDVAKLCGYLSKMLYLEKRLNNDLLLRVKLGQGLGAWLYSESSLPHTVL